jgi:hypothetical protein
MLLPFLYLTGSQVQNGRLIPILQVTYPDPPAMTHGRGIFCEKSYTLRTKLPTNSDKDLPIVFLSIKDAFF